MKRSVLFTGLLFLIIQPNLHAQKSGLQSLWHDENIDQASIADLQDEDNIYYQVSNNQDYLYLNMAIPFADEQKKILLFGLTIYIDPGGKSKKDLAIMYPFRRSGRKFRSENLSTSDSTLLRQLEAQKGTTPSGPGNERSQNTPNSRGQALMNFDMMKYDIADRSRILVLKGLTDTADIVAIPSDDPKEIHVRMAYDSSNVLHYSLVIPFAKVPIKESVNKSGFSIGFESGHFNPPQTQTREGGPGGAGGMGGRPGGGGSGSGRGGAMRPSGLSGGQRGQGGRAMMSPSQRQAMMEQMQVLSVPTKFWIKKIKLAQEE